MKIIDAKSLWVVLETCGKKVRRWKQYLPIINLVLFVGVTGLAMICVLLVYYPPEKTLKLERYTEETPAKNIPLPPLDAIPKPVNHYELILSNNPFSPNRTVWAPPQTSSVPIHREEVIAQPGENQQQKPRGTPKKITLRGILILGDTRKALIENPDQTKNKKPFIFIEEGEEIAEYKVKNIEPDQIKLDWYGEEQIVIMRSNIKK